MDEEPTPVLAELVEIVHQLEQAFTIPLRLAQLEASQAADVVQVVADDRDRLQAEVRELRLAWDKSRHRKVLSEYRAAKYEAVDAAEALRVKYMGLKMDLERIHRKDTSFCSHCEVRWPCETMLAMLMHLGPNPSLADLDVIDD